MSDRASWSSMSPPPSPPSLAMSLSMASSYDDDSEERGVAIPERRSADGYRRGSDGDADGSLADQSPQFARSYDSYQYHGGSAPETDSQSRHSYDDSYGYWDDSYRGVDHARPAYGAATGSGISSASPHGESLDEPGQDVWPEGTPLMGYGGAARKPVGSCGVGLLGSLSMPINVGWAVGEALLVPYLLELGITVSAASFVWLLNPIVGMFVQPVFGVLSDRCHSRFGRRRPFIVAFTATALLGMATVAFANMVFHFKELDVTAAVVFTGFALMDLSHDLLVTPTRAYMVDSLAESQLQSANAWYSAAGNVGRALGLVLASIPLERYYPFTLFHGHLRAVFVVAGALILLQNVVACCAVREVPLGALEAQAAVRASVGGDKARRKPRYDGRPPLAPRSPLRERIKTAGMGRHASPGGAAVNLDVDSVAFGDSGRGGGSANGGSSRLRPEYAMSDFSDGVPDDGGPDDEHMGFCAAMARLCRMPGHVRLLWMVSFAGWLGYHVQCFFWTTWVAQTVFHGGSDASSEPFQDGVRWGTATLAAQAVSAFLISNMLPCVNRFFGTKKVFYFTQLLFIGCIASMYHPLVQTKWGCLVVACISGIFPAAHGNNSYIILELLTEERERAAYVSVLNLSMVVAQIVVGASAGFATEYGGGLTKTFLGAGAIGLVMDVLLIALDCTRHVIPVA